MKMINLTINGTALSVEAGTTLLEAAKSLGVEIPTLCHLAQFTPHTNCMICTVHELKTGRLILSCATQVTEGMAIATDDERTRNARRDTLDLLLSEHLGDCEAPCTRTCPANMNIPLMIRQIKAGDFEQAIRTVKEDIALPAVLGRICPAPCEKGCHRKQHDNALSICALKRFVADTDMGKDSPYKPDIPAISGKNIAVVGAGPAGLSAAYYIARAGHHCVLFESSEKAGGLLRTSISDTTLPKSVLDTEIELILSLGVELKTGQALGRDFTLADIRYKYDAVALCLGESDPDKAIDSKLDYTPRGIAVNKESYEASIPGVFAGGNAVSVGKMAIRASAHGKLIAKSVDQYLNELPATNRSRAFNSSLGKFQDGETDEFLREAGTFDRIEAAGSFETGFDSHEAVKESERCFHCDCRKPKSCKLRRYATEYGSDQRRFRVGDRKRVRKVVQHELIVYEPGKCIKCNLCIDIARETGEEYGLSFIKRGFEVEMAVPFDESLQIGLKLAAEACAAACPTAALALRNNEERLSSD